MAADSQYIRLSRSRRWSAAIYLVLAGLRAACSVTTAAESETQRNMAGHSNCSVIAAPELQHALCVGDSAELFQTIEPILNSSDTERKSTVMRVLVALWNRDQSIGTGLPWDKLSSDNFQSWVARCLAPSVRSGDALVNLDSLRKFAVEYSRKTTQAGYADGIYLIGLTGATGQSGYLTEIALKDVGGQRFTAIVALGTICEEKARSTLIALAKSKSLPAIDRERARVALTFRRSPPTRDWCTKPGG